MAVIKRTGPVALSTTLTTNVYNPTGPEELRLIHVANKTDSPQTFSLWLGATGGNSAGTELFSKKSVPARDSFDFPFLIKMGTADFIVGGADVTAAALTVIISTAQVGV